MTKGSPNSLNAVAHKLSSPRAAHQSHHHPVRSPSDRRSLGDKSSSPSPERHRKRQHIPPPASSSPALKSTNGHDDSEAETEILSDEEQTQERIIRNSVKREPKDDADVSNLVSKARSEPAHSNGPSRASSVSRETSDKKAKKSNGANDGENGKTKEERKEKVRLSVDVSNNGSRAQSAEASTFPHLDDERSRQAQSAEPRKRKFAESQKSSRFEPPRQKPRLDEVSDSARPRKRRPSSPLLTPGTPALRSAHRRSASTQSAAQSAGLNPTRKRRDLPKSQAASATGQKDWSSDMSSDEAAGYPPIPKLAPPPRSARAAIRATTSPARAAPMGKRADRFGSTPLARACEKGNFQSVRQAYEEAPAEIDQADNGGFAPLQKAALEGYADIVQFLLEKGCRTDCASKDDHDTPLIDAVENGHLDVVKLLLDHGVNPHHQNKSGKRAIDAIDDEDDCASDLRDMLQTAMQNYVGSESDSDDDESSDKPIIRPEDKNRTDLLYLEPNRRNLLEYSTKGDVVAVDHFLSSVKPDNACAVVAARGGHHLVLNLLLASAGGQLETDPDPLQYEETPLLAAIGRGLKGHLKIIKLLLQQDHFNPTRKTKDGKFYWEVAEERRGPRWQTERDLLKEYYDAYLAKRKVTRKKKLSADGIAKANREKKSDNSSLAEPLASPQSTKEKKRQLKPSSQMADGKEGKRKHRPVLESSDEDDADEVRAPKKKRKRQDSSASKSSKVGPPSPALSRHSSGSKPSHREENKAAYGLSKMQRKISSEKQHSLKSPASARSSSKASTPESTREARKAEEEARAAKSAQKAAEAEKKKREAAEAAALAEDERKAREAQEERQRKEKEELERKEQEDIERKQKEDLERKQKEELERKQEEELKRKRTEELERKQKEELERKQREELERKQKEELERKQKEELERKEREERERKEREENERRIASLPLALRLAVRDSRDRPLMFACATSEHREKYGIGMQFLPLFTASLRDLDAAPDESRLSEMWIMNFQVVGILGLPSELRLAEFPDWERRPVTDEQKRFFLESYDISKLAQDYKWPQPGDRGHDAWANLRRLEETRRAFLAMEPLQWVKLSDFETALTRPEYDHLRKLRMRAKPAKIKEPEDLPPPDFWTESDADAPAAGPDELDGEKQKVDSVAGLVVEEQKDT